MRSRIDWSAPGMRRLKLLLWALYNRTPLDRPINEVAEREAARRVRMAWDTYCRHKAAHPELWAHFAALRERARANGGFRPQPAHLRRHRNGEAVRRARMRKDRPRFAEWAARKLLKARDYRSPHKRHRVLNRLTARLLGW